MVALSAVVLFMYMAILGLAAIAIYVVAGRDHRKNLRSTRAVSWQLLGLHAVLGLLFFAVPILLLNYIILLPGSGSRAFGVFICFPLLYLALSSCAILYAGYFRTLFASVYRLHMWLAGLMTVILVLSIPLLPTRGDTIFFITAAGTALSAILAYRQGTAARDSS
jgi:hypothetical protein